MNPISLNNLLMLLINIDMQFHWLRSKILFEMILFIFLIEIRLIMKKKYELFLFIDEN